MRCSVMMGYSLAALSTKTMHRCGNDPVGYVLAKMVYAVVKFWIQFLRNMVIYVDRSYYKISKFLYKKQTAENYQHVLPVFGRKKAKKLDAYLLNN